MTFARDLSAAFRSFRKNPGFTAAVVGMLAVGIGATTAMFSIADGVLFAPLPYTHEKQLVAIVNRGTRRGDHISPPDLFNIGKGVKSLVEVGGIYAGPGLLTGEGDPLQVGKGTVTANWFSMLGIHPEIGRFFDDQDREGATKVVIVNDAFVNAYLGGRDPIGRIVANGGEIVGVIGDTKNQSLTEAPDPELYTPYDQLPVGYLTVLVRSSASRASVVATARKLFAGFNKDLPIFGEGTYDDLVRSTASRSEQSWELVAGFSLFALLLSAAGIYSVVAFAVRERRREFGVRIALGAQQRQIVALVIRHAAVLSALGVSLGLGVSLAASSALRAVLYGVGTTDLATYAAGCAVLVIATLAASCIPAWSAGRVDPMMVMRVE